MYAHALSSPYSDNELTVTVTKKRAHSILFTAAADLALTQSSSSTPLEVAHATFLMSLAHQARLIMCVRGLDTGVAQDISGVLRVSRGAEGWLDRDNVVVEEREYLYHVAGDVGVKVFERGA